MIEFLRNWVLNIITLVILIVLLEILIPSGKMKKYINMVSGFILIIAIVTPFLGVFKKGIDLKDIQMNSSNFLDRKEIEANSKLLKEKQTKQIVETYRKKIIKQVEEGLRDIKEAEGAKVDVIINEDYKSERFGDIKRVYVTVESENQKTVVKPVAKVEKIEISRETPGEDKKTEGGRKDVEETVRKKLEDKINKILDVQKENIVIAQRG